jgi:hypothetical protein
MVERLHVFAGSPELLESRHMLRRMAACLTGDGDVSTEESLAASYDQALGGDDAIVGMHMSYLIHGSSDPREYVERVIMACDLLRRARRTLH